MFKFRPLCLALLTCLSVFSAQTVSAADEPDKADNAITPYRPSVSNSAQLPVEGQLELELGISSQKADAATSRSLPYLFKLAFSKEWGVLLGGNARVVNDDGAGQRDQGFGDTTLTLKRAFVISDETAFGLEVGNKFPTAGQPIGSGKSDWTINGIVSQDLGKIHADVNLNVTHQGFAETGTSNWQKGFSSSFSTELADKWGGTAEWATWRRAGADAQGQLLFALTYSPSKRMTIDFGVTKGLNSISSQRSLFAGIVVPVAKLW
ncbi:transporter [Undibacterium sp. TJN19]|uniref:transporter n=1 Tax=Undibacterium sp. TJN19 TaxID=3413055 RepID=UPI003BEF634F